MKLKKIIALFCLLTLATQMLPVKEIGAILFGNEVNEEIPHCIDAGKDAAFKLLLKTDPFIQQFAGYNFLPGAVSEYVHFASLIPHNHTGEITTPPPNQL